jgi:nitroreductase
MEVFEAVRTVLAVRKYQDKPVSAEIIRQVVEAGHLTASSQNGQPWHFIVIQKRDTLRQIGALAHSGPYIAQAAFAIAVAVERTKFAVSDGSRAIQSMILTAWAQGVGSNWVGFMRYDEVKPLLGIPDDVDVLALVPFGYPDQVTGHGKKQRKPLAEVAHRERFDQPFE